MNVHESNRTRTLVIRLDRGDELPVALMRALDEAEARSAWITGSGSLEAAEIAVYDQQGRPSERARRIDAPAALVSLSGNAALEGGALSLRLSATLCRETEVGPQIFAGQLIWARSLSVELCVTALDDLALTRAADDRTGLSQLSGRRHEAPAAPVAAPAAATPARTPSPSPSPVVSQPHTPPTPLTYTQQTSTLPASYNDSPAMPQRPARPKEEHVETYPEVGDAVTHFAFGECKVVFSDGDRIRLQQDRDGRVREVALTMLRIGPPTTQADGRRHFDLSRKN